MDEDPYGWLEDVHGERALDWVRQRNAATRTQLEAVAGFAALRSELRAILDSREQIPYVERHGQRLYNLWRDASQPRGLWRCCTLDEYRKPQPAWQILIDLDALATAEGENWVWAGASGYGPDYRRWLISLSRGGADASVVREFDTDHRAFVAGGFEVAEAKCWNRCETASRLTRTCCCN
jgi:prolyl oligopeptidase